MQSFVVILLLIFSLPAFAVDSSAVSARQEIKHLIEYLAISGCQFNRNGSWYGATRAVSHLNRKLEYLTARNLAPTAEAFIENAASESNSSGKPYLVRCAGKPDVQSGAWFRAELERFRKESDKS